MSTRDMTIDELIKFFKYQEPDATVRLVTEYRNRGKSGYPQEHLEVRVTILSASQDLPDNVIIHPHVLSR